MRHTNDSIERKEGTSVRSGAAEQIKSCNFLLEQQLQYLEVPGEVSRRGSATFSLFSVFCERFLLQDSASAFAMLETSSTIEWSY